MRVRPDHLLTLACIARTGSLTHAARLLGKTQPAVSIHMKLLAEAVGEPLLARRHSGVTLTPAGEALLPAAQSIAKSVDVAEQISERLQGLELGLLRVLTSTTVAVYYLPTIMDTFHRLHPSIDLRIIHHNTDEALKALETNEGDVAMVRRPSGPLPENFVSRLLLEDETLFVVRPDHPLARRNEIRFGELAGVSLVLQGMHTGTRQLAERLAHKANFKLRVKFEVISVMAIKEAVLQGFGGGLISRLAVQRELRAGELVSVRIRDDELYRPIMLIYPIDLHLSPRVRAFLETLERQLADKANTKLA